MERGVDRRQFLKAVLEMAAGSALVGGGIGDRVAGALKDRKIWDRARRAVEIQENIPPPKFDEAVNELAKQKKAEEGHSEVRDWVDVIMPAPGAVLVSKGIHDLSKTLYPMQNR